MYALIQILSCSSTPFHVRFGRSKVLIPKEKRVKITVNGEDKDLCMKVLYSCNVIML